MLALTVLFGALNERRLQKINGICRPAVQLSEHLREVLVAINNELRGAVATRDPALLLSSDSLRSDFLATLESKRTSEAFELRETQAIRQSFDGYFLPARAVSGRLILEQTIALDMNELAVMRVRFDSTLRLLASSTVTARHNID